MSNESIPELVGSRIARDRQEAQATARRALASNTPLTDASISEFFPELEQLPDRRRSNLPTDVPLLHQLLLGPPTVFDLEPLAERAFEERYRITVRMAEELTELGRILPNLYVREPDAWHGMNHLEGLIRRSLVNGERVEAYFSARNTQFHALVGTRAQILAKALREAETTRPKEAAAFIADARSPRSEAARVVGTRWAYLDVLAPHASSRVAEQVALGRIAEASMFMRLTKHLYVSPITASLGGEFIWGRSDIAHLRRTSGLAETPPFPAVSERANPEAVEFLLHHITRVRPFQFIKDFQGERLLALLRNKELMDLKLKLFSTTELMTRLTQRGEVREGTVNEWINLVAEIQRVIATFEKNARRAANVLATYTVGTVVEPLAGIGAGAFAEMFLSEFTEKWGKAIHSYVSRDKHRFVVLLDELRSATKEDDDRINDS